MKILIVINDPPYGSERSYNALRLANQLATRDAMELSVFLMADAVLCAKAGQQTPQGYYNIERMLKPIVRKAKLFCAALAWMPGESRMTRLWTVRDAEPWWS